jgi:hypothetical protein
MEHRTQEMARYLDIQTEPEKPVRVKEDHDDEDAERIEQVQCIPEYVGVMGI